MVDLERLIRSLSRQPLVRRRRILAAHWRVQRTLGMLDTYGVADIIRLTLQVSERVAHRIEAELVLNDRLQMLEWLAASSRTEAELADDDTHVRVADPTIFTRLAESGTPVVLAPLHMGIFSLGIMHIAHTYFRGRRILVLRAREDRETSAAAMKRLERVASEFRILNIRNTAEFMPAMRFAREGALIVCLVDLPASYGNPADVRLFNKPARIALGVDSIARMTGGMVVPMAVASSVTGDLVTNGRPFDVVSGAQTERWQVAERIAAEIQRFVHCNPSHWHMWARLGEFMPEGAERNDAVA